MAELIFLTDHEREHFAAWLEQEAESSRLLLKQLEKLPQGVVVADHMKLEAAACALIAKKLRSTESMTVSGRDD